MAMGFLGLAILGCAKARAQGAAPEVCATLCGSWQLDVAASDALGLILDRALVDYKRPRLKQPRIPAESNVEAMTRAADEAALGPIQDRPEKRVLRAELMQALAPASRMTIIADGTDILITALGSSAQKISPGEPHARVDEFGTARIRAGWQKQQLIVTEAYDRRHQLQRSYGWQRKTDSLLFSQRVTRPGMPATTLRSVYRRIP
jgi:hypothetical protein